MKNTLGSVFIISVLALVIATPSNAAMYDYSGTIVGATGLFTPLFPLGTPITGYMVFSDAAVQAGYAGENDLIDLVVQIGGFCLFLQNNNCVGVALPFNVVDYIGVTFDLDGNVTGGEIRGATSLPADPYIPWLFDFTANTLVSDIFNGGVLTADTSLVQAIPVPGAVWLLSSACACLAGWRRSK